jgi:dynein heavy chain, axonemal
LQKRVDVYLDGKREAFPRFFFLADRDLLHVLSHSREPAATQPHVRALFEGAKELLLEGEGHSLDVLGMRSAEEEVLSFGKQLKARGPPEGVAILQIIDIFPILHFFDVPNATYKG